MHDKPGDSTRKKQPSRLKLFSFYLIMIGMTALVCFIVLEYGLARFYEATESHLPLTTFDTNLGWRLNPGSYWVKPRHTFKKHEIAISTQGLRNGMVAPAAPRGSRRIVVLGDSFTFAMAMPHENTFPVLLQNTLKGKGGSYEVINAGVYGYGTAQEMLFMKELARQGITGDVYILMVFVNDILDNLRLSEYGSSEKSPAPPGFALDSGGGLTLSHRPQKDYSPNLVSRRPRFFIVDVLENGMRTFLQTKPWLVNILTSIGMTPTLPRTPGLISGWYADDVLKQGVPLMKALMKEIREEARRNHAQFLVSMIPSPLQVYPDVYSPILIRSFSGSEVIARYVDDPARPQKIVAQMCSDLEIPFLDLYPLLLQDNSEELFIPADGHFSREGHTVVSEHLSKFVIAHSSNTSDTRITHSAQSKQ